jgi:uncharacterized membrane protein YdjX (TVP38/TMEM64 family)
MKEKIYKALIVSVVTLVVMFAFELIFLIPGVESTFLAIMQNDTRWMAWVGLWIVMFLQTSIIPIPGLSILVIAKNMQMITLSPIKDILFYVVVMTSYLAGVAVAYWMGRKWGKKAVKWVAGSDEEYEHWANIINKKGKWFYFLTVLLPIFPDDLLCLVAGSIKFDFKFFLFSNIVARLIGLVTTVYVLLTAMSVAGSTMMVIIYGILLLANIVGLIVFKQKREEIR